MWGYLKPEGDLGLGAGASGLSSAAPAPNASAPQDPSPKPQVLPPIDRTYKLFIGGKQARPDQGYSRKIVAPDGRVLGEVAEGNRKDVRNAVAAAHAAEGWGRAAASRHLRAQLL